MISSVPRTTALVAALAVGLLVASMLSVDVPVPVDPVWLQLDPASGLPVRVHAGRHDLLVDADVTRIVTADVLVSGLTALNRAGGSAWWVTVRFDDAVVGSADDGQHRVFRQPCGTTTRRISWVDLRTQADPAAGLAWVVDADIGLCDELRGQPVVKAWLALRHEIGHVAGLGHVVSASMTGHRPGMPEAGVECVPRLMYPLMNRRQVALQPADVRLLQALYPGSPP